MPSLDFKKVVEEIAHSGAFKNFEKPMGDPTQRIAGEYRYPLYPGDDGFGDIKGAYASSVRVLVRAEQDIPSKCSMPGIAL